MDFLWNLEISITLFLQNLGLWLKLPFQALSFLATEKFFIIIMPLIFWSVDSLMGLRMAFMLVISDSFNAFFKMIFHSPRPFWFDQRVQSLSQETSFGLPSGHSQNSASLFGMVAATARKKWLTIVTLILIFLIGLSRIYLGMHFLRDVLSGWLIAGLLLALYFWLETPVAKWLSTKTLAFQVLMAFCFSLLLMSLGISAKLLSSSWQMPAQWIETAVKTGGAIPDPFNIEGVITEGGVAFGFMTGLACWIKKYGMPKVKGTAMKRFLRYIVGIVGVIAIYLGLKLVFPSDPELVGFIFRYIRYSVLGLWVSFLAPLLFVKWKLD